MMDHVVKCLGSKPNTLSEALDIILSAKKDELNLKLQKVQVVEFNGGGRYGKEKESEATMGKAEACQ